MLGVFQLSFLGAMSVLFKVIKFVRSWECSRHVDELLAMF